MVLTRSLGNSLCWPGTDALLGLPRKVATVHTQDFRRSVVCIVTHAHMQSSHRD